MRPAQTEPRVSSVPPPHERFRDCPCARAQPRWEASGIDAMLLRALVAASVLGVTGSTSEGFPDPLAPAPCPSRTLPVPPIRPVSELLDPGGGNEREDASSRNEPFPISCDDVLRLPCPRAVSDVDAALEGDCGTASRMLRDAPCHVPGRSDPDTVCAHEPPSLVRKRQDHHGRRTYQITDAKLRSKLPRIRFARRSHRDIPGRSLFVTQTARALTRHFRSAAPG
jgi:hypothetical protein